MATFKMISWAAVFLVATLVTGYPNQEVKVDQYSRASNKPGLGQSAFETIHAELTDFNAGCNTYTICGSNVQDVDCTYISGDNEGDITGYYGVNFGNGAVSIKVAIAVGYGGSAGSGRIDIRLDSPNGDLIGSVITGATGGWQTWVVVETFLRFPVPGGIHDVYLSFQKECANFDCETYPMVANLDWFIFYQQGV